MKTNKFDTSLLNSVLQCQYADLLEQEQLIADHQTHLNSSRLAAAAIKQTIKDTIAEISATQFIDQCKTQKFNAVSPIHCYKCKHKVMCDKLLSSSAIYS